MKTVHVSVEFWRRLKMVAAERGVSVRGVLEEIGDGWMAAHPGPREAAGAARVNALAVAEMQSEALKRSADRVVRELKVELEE